MSARDTRSVTIPLSDLPAATYGTGDINAVYVSIYYSKGGTNVWNGKSDPRGYWLSLTPANVYEMDDGKGGKIAMVSRHIALGRASYGGRLLVRSASRFSDKHFAAVVDLLLPHARDLAAAAVGGATPLRAAVDAALASTVGTGVTV